MRESGSVAMLATANGTPARPPLPNVVSTVPGAADAGAAAISEARIERSAPRRAMLVKRDARARVATKPRPPPSPHPKYHRRGGLFQAPGCAPYWLAASDEGSNAMGIEEHAAVIDRRDVTGICTVRPDCYAVGF